MTGSGSPSTSRPRRSLWWSVTAPLATVGAAGAFLLLGVGSALVLLGLGTAGTALARWQRRQVSAPARPLGGTWPPALDLLGGCALLAAVGLVAEFGAVGLGASAAVAAARVLPRYRRRRSGGSRPGRHRTVAPDVPPAEIIPGDPLPEPSSVRDLSTTELCWTWRLSYVRVRKQNCPAYQLAHLATFRSACLDELERRDPVAFHRWLPTARAAGDPARFFCPQQHR